MNRYIMDIYLKSTWFTADSIQSCIAACARVDRFSADLSGSAATNIHAISENAGYKNTLIPGSREALIAKGTQELLENFHAGESPFSLSNTSVKVLHRHLLKYSPRDTEYRGRYRATPDKELHTLFETAQTALSRPDRHPLFTISIFRAVFIRIMPFISGNVLLANILSYFLLFLNGYPFVAQLPLINMLNNPPKVISSEPLVMLPEAISSLLEEYHLLFPVPQDIQGAGRSPYLNPRRRELLYCVIKHSPLKISDIMQHLPEQNRNTIKKDLLFLRENKMISARGDGRGTVYTSYTPFRRHSRSG